MGKATPSPSGAAKKPPASLPPAAAAAYARLEESEQRLMEMLLTADTDGDGSLSQLEFALA